MEKEERQPLTSKFLDFGLVPPSAAQPASPSSTRSLEKSSVQISAQICWL